MACRVAIIGTQSYGKVSKDTYEEVIIMEYEFFYKNLVRYMPNAGKKLLEEEDFMEYMEQKSNQKAYQLSDFIMMTLPYPRMDYYKSSNFFDTQRMVTGYANNIIDSLGFFPVKMNMEVLKRMETFGQAVMFLGLIFNIIILLFAILSILLIYSLLSISVETKTFEFGVMRMIGLSKTGIINMIVLQGFMFVLPSLIVGFIVSVPCLNVLNKIIFGED
jgi:ABC-type antimicrobial peptide transport system permease subunit